MTTVSWTASAPVTPAGKLAFPGQNLIAKIGRAFVSILAAMAPSDSDYLGLDLNGNPMWVKR